MSRTSDPYAPRAGEVALPFDPAVTAADARLQFIGRIATPWRNRGECPRNPGQSDALCTVQVDAPFRPGLASLDGVSHVILLYWMHEARRDLIVQAPRHSGAGAARGCFALRTPVRPNPISLAVAELIACDPAEGTLTVRGLDCLDGTPLLDIKPYFASIDARPEAVVGWQAEGG